MNYPYIVPRKTIGGGGRVQTRRYAHMICKDISGKMWHCFVYQSIQLVPSKSNHLHARFYPTWKKQCFFLKLLVQVWIFSIADQHKSKTGVSWVRAMNSFGHLSAGVRYVLIHFDVIGYCPKRMNLDLGSNMECIPVVNINLIEPGVKCSMFNLWGRFFRVWNKMNEIPKP